jgi:hypothetical protein
VNRTKTNFLPTLRALEKAADRLSFLCLHRTPRSKGYNRHLLAKTVAIDFKNQCPTIFKHPNRQHKPTADAHAKLDSIEFGNAP